MKREINVLSLFDGMSCGQIALKNLKIPVNKYYACEIDKPAIRQTQHNFPETIQLGGVKKLRLYLCCSGSNRKYMETYYYTSERTKALIKHIGDIITGKIDLFIGGSPCQGFSFAGKKLNFNDPRSKLFFEFVKIWEKIKELNPDALFLLENVNMKKQFLRVITEHMGVWPVRINSNLVSAQNRDRWYWTNIRTRKEGLFEEIHSHIPQPEDRNIFLKDVLQPEHEVHDKYYLTQKIIEGYINHKIRHKEKNNVIQVNPSKESNGKQPYQQNRVYHTDGKNPCLMSKPRGSITDRYALRLLTPIECARLQTIPEWYEWIVSDTQIYKMLGNGWTVDVIAHIFKQLRK